MRAHRLHDALLASGRGLVVRLAASVPARCSWSREIALSLMLLVGAALLIQSFARMQRVDVGFSGSSVLTVDRIELPRAPRGGGSERRVLRLAVARLRSVPGVESAAVTLGLPLDPRARFFVDESTFSIAGQPPLPAAQRPAAPLHVVSTDYFAAIGVPLTARPLVRRSRRAGAPGVVIINESMARRFWPNENPIGRRITHDLSIVPRQQTAREIVGVVGDVRHFGLERAAEPQMFVPHAQMPWPSMAVVLRTPLDAGTLSAASQTSGVEHGRARFRSRRSRPMDDVFASAVGQPRFRAWLLGLFAAIAILLAMTGLYGTMAYAAQQRTREIGLRIALGATPQQATAPLVRQGLTIAGIGTPLGLAGSVAVARGLSRCCLASASTT